MAALAVLKRSTTFLIQIAAIAILLLFAQDAVQSEETLAEREQTQSLLSGLETIAIRDKTEVEVQIARNLLEVKDGRMTPQQFYQKLSEMTMPPHMEARHLLNKMKKDIFDAGGAEGMKRFFGTQFADGGSQVEQALLQWRRKLVFDAIGEVMQQFKGRNVRGNKRFSVFLAEIGSWTKESPEAMKFAGDIDFSFLSGDLELSKEMQAAFARIILRETGLTPEGIDAVCTAHGMATEEVYVGPHGQSFGEDAMQKSNLVVLDFVNGTMTDQRVPGAQALQQVVLEAKLAKVGLTDILTVKWPTEPGISLEMIRHFEHDIMKKNIYGDVDSFLKAVKYLDRSTVARLGKGVTPADPLSQFAVVLIGMKETGTSPDVMAAFIMKHFQEATGKPFPQISLGPANAEGLSKAEIADRDGAIRLFWEKCRDKMWDNAMHGFRSKVAELKKTTGAAKKETAAAAFEEIAKLREMMEVEMRVLTDSEVGVDALPPEFTKLLEDFRADYKAFVRKFPEVGGEKVLASLKFIDEMLKARKPSSVKLAMAALMESPHFVNNFLDIIDDTLLGEIRGASPDWDDYLQKQKELRWAAEAEKVTGINRNAAAQAAQQHAGNASRIWGALNKDLTGIFSGALTARIQKTNQILGGSIQSSSLARGSMTALAAFNLYEEIPAYVNLFYKGAKDGDWESLAAEIFRRRIPFGSAVENYVMGNYYLALWDFCSTLVPPLSLPRVAMSIAQAITEMGFRFWYHSELELFVDTLYASATFQLDGVSRINNQIALGNWKLIKVNYRSNEIVVNEYIGAKEKQIAEMVALLRLPKDQREFPVDYDSSDPLTGWTSANDVLRENLRNTDEALLVLDELRSDPIAGPKLKENYSDFYLTRWAQVKLNFMIHTIRRLEERRAAEQAMLSGQLPRLMEELQRASTELAIAKEVAASMEQEAGSAFWQFVVWLRDWTIGQKRSFSAQPDIEDVLEKGARVLIRYTETYTTVLDARTNAEQMFAQGAPVDRGLRLLTGGYFLQGKADSDGSAYQAWAATPAAKQAAADAELSGIKRKYLPGTRLDLTPGSFDRSTLDMVSFHDVWRELWKHVQSQGIREEPGFWEIMRNYWQPVTAPGSTGPDPTERHGFHKSQRDALVASFEEHYRGSVPTVASRESEEQKNEKCVQLQKEAGRINGVLTNLNTKLDAVQVRITALQKTIADMSVKEKDAAGGVQQAAQSAQKVVEIRGQMENAALAVCTGMERHRASQLAEERKKIAGEITKLLQQAEQLNSSATTEHQGAVKSAEKTEAAFDALKTIPERIKAIQEELDVLSKELAGLTGELDVARSAVAAIQGTSPLCDPRTAEAVRSAEEGIVILTSKLESLTSISISETDVMIRADRVGDQARDARASADTAEVFIEGLSSLLDDARSCSRIAAEPLPQEGSVDKVFFVVRIEGSGYTPTWAGESYAMTGSEEVVFRMRKGEDLAAILQGHRKSLLRSVCDMHTPPPMIYKDRAPVIWQAGPKLTVVQGPILSEGDAFTWKTAHQWKLTNEHAPGLTAIREAAGCD